MTDLEAKKLGFMTDLEAKQLVELALRTMRAGRSGTPPHHTDQERDMVAAHPAAFLQSVLQASWELGKNEAV